MKQLRIHKFSRDFSGLRLDDVEAPAVTEQRPLLVRVKASSINPVDIKMVTGESKALMQGRLPIAFGVDFCGVVEKLHPSARGFSIGDHVIGYTGIATPRAFSEWLAAHPSEVARVDQSLSFDGLGAIPLNALTAYQALRFGSITKGSRVLIHGGGGGVGSMAIQIAKTMGAEVFTTASRKDFEYLNSLGVNHCIDFKSEDFSTKLRDLDFVLDIMGGAILKKSAKCVRKGGTIVSTSAAPHPDELLKAGLKLNPVLRSILRLMNEINMRRARSQGVQFKATVTHPNSDDLKAITDLVHAGLSARVGAKIQFRELPVFLKESSEEHSQPKYTGKTVLCFE